MSETVRPIRIASGIIVGFLVGAGVGVTASRFPVFHWEMAGLVVLVFSAIAGRHCWGHCCEIRPANGNTCGWGFNRSVVCHPFGDRLDATR